MTFVNVQESLRSNIFHWTIISLSSFIKVRIKRQRQLSGSAYCALACFKTWHNILKGVSCGQEVCIKEMCNSELWEAVQISRGSDLVRMECRCLCREALEHMKFSTLVDLNGRGFFSSLKYKITQKQWLFRQTTQQNSWLHSSLNRARSFPGYSQPCCWQ